MHGETSQMKRPWLAVALNLFVLVMGLGYLYIGKWGRFAIVFGLQLTTLFFFTAIGLRELNKWFLILIWIVSLIDVYNQAESYNVQHAKNSRS